MSEEIEKKPRNGNGYRMTERRDYLLSFVLMFALAGIIALAFFVSAYPMDWNTLQLIVKMSDTLQLLVVSIITGYFALSQNRN